MLLLPHNLGRISIDPGVSCTVSHWSLIDKEKGATQFYLDSSTEWCVYPRPMHVARAVQD